MLFNEPKLLKFAALRAERRHQARFSALQRAEIAEIASFPSADSAIQRFSALQRAEIAEILWGSRQHRAPARFSALQRAEIAEIADIQYRIIEWDEFQCSSTSRNC